MKAVGFSGTREGMTESQQAELRSLLRAFCAKELHHGDCVGADAEAHAAAVALGLRTVLHPPSNTGASRAHCAADEVRRAVPYLERNRRIVRETEVLVAAPRTATEPSQKRGGGTWATVRYARKLQREVYILFP